MVEIMDSFKNRLEQALAYRNMKPADLSRASGISESTISQYRSGYSKPKDKRLVILANVLRVDPAWLMGLDVPMDVQEAAWRKALEPLAQSKVEEDALLTDFRKLNDKGKELARVYVRSLSQMRDYNIEEAAP